MKSSTPKYNVHIFSQRKRKTENSEIPVAPARRRHVGRKDWKSNTPCRPRPQKIMRTTLLSLEPTAFSHVLLLQTATNSHREIKPGLKEEEKKGIKSHERNLSGLYGPYRGGGRDSPKCQFFSFANQFRACIYACFALQNAIPFLIFFSLLMNSAPEQVDIYIDGLTPLLSLPPSGVNAQ